MPRDGVSHIATTSLRFARERYDDTKFVADRLIDAIAEFSAVAEDKPLDISGTAFLLDLEEKSAAAEARHQHALNKLRWELAQPSHR